MGAETTRIVTYSANDSLDVPNLVLALSESGVTLPKLEQRNALRLLRPTAGPSGNSGQRQSRHFALSVFCV
jgi:hypothetical protein